MINEVVQTIEYPVISVFTLQISVVSSVESKYAALRRICNCVMPGGFQLMICFMFALSVLVACHSVLQHAEKPKSPLVGRYTREFLHGNTSVFLETLSSMCTCRYKLKQAEACYAEVPPGN